MTLTATITAPAPHACDICSQRIETGERYTHDPKGETTHNDCARDWFRRNFGRESL